MPTKSTQGIKRGKRPVTQETVSEATLDLAKTFDCEMALVVLQTDKREPALNLHVGIIATGEICPHSVAAYLRDLARQIEAAANGTTLVRRAM